MVIKWQKNSAASGYQVRYGTSSNISGGKILNISGKNTVSKTLSNLKKNQRYYIRIRTYKTVSGKKYYSAWSAVKSVKVTK